MTADVFELWINLIPYMKYDFEWRRSMMAFSSIIIIDPSNLNQILKNNLSFILKKIIYFGEKLLENIKRKNLEANQGKLSDLDVSEVFKII